MIQLTDLHFMSKGWTQHAWSPALRLELAVDEINRLHSDTDFVMITGDLAHFGEKQAYLDVRKILDNLMVPLFIAVGNHDDRDILYAVFPEIEPDDQGFGQYVIDTKAGVFLVLDTKQEKSHAGRLCTKRLQWLENQLDIYRGRPQYIFMHHVPCPLSLPSIDLIGLENSREFGDLLLSKGNIRHIFCGHIHRPLTGNWRSLQFSCLRGINHQVDLDFRVDRNTIPYNFEPPQYTVNLISPASVVVHYHDFLDDSPRFFFENEKSESDRQLPA